MGVVLKLIRITFFLSFNGGCQIDRITDRTIFILWHAVCILFKKKQIERSPMKALIIDDNKTLRRMFQMFLENMGFESDTAENGSVAFQRIQSADYDIIITDMKMPIINGMDFYQLVSSYRPYMLERIVFSTGDAFNPEYEDFFQKSSCPVLYKPFSLSDLEDIIHSLNISGLGSRRAAGRVAASA